ncbi:GGDEF domain-containing protein [Cellvibrio sp. ARAG 10.3]|uniref:GGDEF domain-containing protein n=1 Tax=Cellvibrio sp. ARAG 10.3 TaxID=3451358 RepID=UPI003F445630
MVDRPDDTTHHTNWRDKYLDALDTQEAIEQQRELLRRALVRLSVSADGHNDSLDDALDGLRHALRKDNPLNTGDLQKVFDQLDQAVVRFEQHREETGRQMSQALTDILRPFHNRPLSRALKKDIGNYLAQIPGHSEKIRLYPALLEHLAQLQQRVFEELQQPAAGILQKLFGNTAATATANSEDPEIKSPEVNGGATPSDVAQAPVHHLATHSGVMSSTPAQEIIVSNVSQVLSDMLDKVDVPDAIAPDVEIIRQRLHQGLTTDNVITTLEHVRDLMVEAYLAANQAFANYLNNVNQELADIYRVIGGVAEHQASRCEVSRNLQDSMMQQVASLETHVATATELNQLKAQVTSQLGNIRQALDTFQHSEQDQQRLTGQLQTLAEKIKAMEEDAERNRNAMEKHRYKALHDPLTELPNREAYNERVEAEWQRWQRYDHPLTLAVCDLDHFKKINDNFGHQAGDRVLKVISRSIAKRLREVDFFGRYGGEEFVVIMPETPLDKAVAVLEKIRAAIANTAFNYKEEPLAITLSMGITEFRPGDTTDSVFARADRALYSAKAGGRNRCVVAE